MSKDHRWGERRPGEVRWCLRTGCTVQVRNAFREWRATPRGPWTSLVRALIPDCTGGPVPMKPGK